MIVLGLDPGSRITGYGLLEQNGHDIKVLGAGIIKLDQESDMLAKLLRLRQAIQELVNRFHPTQGAVETQFHGINARSALLVGQIRGAILLAFAENQLSCGEYPPATIKKTVTGNGQASKEQLCHMIGRLTRTPDLEKQHDAADALGIAYTHLQHSQKVL